MRPRHNVPLMMGTAFMLVALAGCAGSSEGAEGEGQSSGSGGQQAGASGLTISEPKNGADVTAPITLKFTSQTPLGPEETGRDHVHIFIDGNETEYEVVPTSPHTITNIPNGEHTINVTQQHADHSPAGPETEIKVNVTGGGSTGGDTGGDTGGGYDYGGGGGY